MPPPTPRVRGRPGRRARPGNRRRARRRLPGPALDHAALDHAPRPEDRSRHPVFYLYFTCEVHWSAMAPTRTLPGEQRPAAPLRAHLHRARTAAGHCGDPSAWRNAFRLHPAAPSLIPALRVGLATATVLTIGGATGHRDLAALAGLGAITAAFARGEPYGRRAGK